MAIQFLRGTSEQRIASTQVLPEGQPFYETDTCKQYIGDGISALKDLSGTNIGLNIENSIGAGSLVVKTGDDPEVDYINYAQHDAGIALGDLNRADGRKSIALGTQNNVTSYIPYKLKSETTYAELIAATKDVQYAYLSEDKSKYIHFATNDGTTTTVEIEEDEYNALSSDLQIYKYIRTQANSSIAVGQVNTVYGNCAGAFGYGNELGISAGHTYVFGKENKVDAYRSFVAGEGNELTGGYVNNTLLGYHLKSDKKSYNTFVGKYNEDVNAIFGVGIGTGPDDRRNALIVNQSGLQVEYLGNNGFKNTGTVSTANSLMSAGEYSVRQMTKGKNNGNVIADGKVGSFALGLVQNDGGWWVNNNEVNGDNCFVHGVLNKANGNEDYVFGEYNTTSTGGRNFVFGGSNTVNHFGTSVLGSGLRTGRDYQTVVGRYNTADPNAWFVVGGGDAYPTKNVLSVTNDGVYAGNSDDANVKLLTAKDVNDAVTDAVTETKQYTDNKIGAIGETTVKQYTDSSVSAAVTEIKNGTTVAGKADIANRAKTADKFDGFTILEKASGKPVTFNLSDDNKSYILFATIHVVNTGNKIEAYSARFIIDAIGKSSCLIQRVSEDFNTIEYLQLNLNVEKISIHGTYLRKITISEFTNRAISNYVITDLSLLRIE